MIVHCLCCRDSRHGAWALTATQLRRFSATPWMLECVIQIYHEKMHKIPRFMVYIHSILLDHSYSIRGSQLTLLTILAKVALGADRQEWAEQVCAHIKGRDCNLFPGMDSLLCKYLSHLWPPSTSACISQLV